MRKTLKKLWNLEYEKAQTLVFVGALGCAFGYDFYPDLRIVFAAIGAALAIGSLLGYLHRWYGISEALRIPNVVRTYEHAQPKEHHEPAHRNGENTMRITGVDRPVGDAIMQLLDRYGAPGEKGKWGIEDSWASHRDMESPILGNEFSDSLESLAKFEHASDAYARATAGLENYLLTRTTGHGGKDYGERRQTWEHGLNPVGIGRSLRDDVNSPDSNLSKAKQVAHG